MLACAADSRTCGASLHYPKAGNVSLLYCAQVCTDSCALLSQSFNGVCTVALFCLMNCPCVTVSPLVLTRGVDRSVPLFLKCTYLTLRFVIGCSSHFSRWCPRRKKYGPFFSSPLSPLIAVCPASKPMHVAPDDKISFPSSHNAACQVKRENVTYRRSIPIYRDVWR